MRTWKMQKKQKIRGKRGKWGNGERMEISITRGKSTDVTKMTDTTITSRQKKNQSINHQFILRGK
jgi:uncharacterized protein (UPF0333 family)